VKAYTQTDEIAVKSGGAHGTGWKFEKIPGQAELEQGTLGLAGF